MTESIPAGCRGSLVGRPADWLSLLTGRRTVHHRHPAPAAKPRGEVRTRLYPPRAATVVAAPAERARSRADRRAGAQAGRKRPLYARMLGLRALNPGGVLCFIFFDGMITLGILLTLAELESWRVIIALPVAVAIMVKVNDLVAAGFSYPAAARTRRERAVPRAGRDPEGWAGGTLSVPAAQGRSVPGRSVGVARPEPASLTGFVPPARAVGSVPIAAVIAAGGQVRRQPSWPVQPPYSNAYPPSYYHSESAEYRVARQRAGSCDAVDSPQWRARQAASRRYQSANRHYE